MRKTTTTLLAILIFIVGVSAETRYPLSLSIDRNSVIIKKEPRRILSMAPNMTELLFDLGAGGKIVARSHYCTFPKEAAAIPSFGDLLMPDFEKIVAYSPDIALGAAYYKDATIRHLRAMNIDVVQQNIPQRVEGLYRYIIEVGTVINHTREADSLVRALQQRVSELKQKGAALRYHPRVYYAVSSGIGGEYTAGKDTYLSDLIELCGGINIAKETTGWLYNIENLLVHDPDIIIGDLATLNIMQSQANYKNLTAIKHKNFIIIDRNIFSRLGPRLLYGGADTLMATFKNFTQRSGK